MLVAAALAPAAGAALAGDAQPPGRPPAGTPPPAWIATGGTSRWLAYASWCWDSSCPRFRSPAARTDIPVLRGALGSLATVHLGFRARTVRVGPLGRPGSVLRAPARTVRVRLTRRGLLLIAATATGRGQVTYALIVR